MYRWQLSAVLVDDSETRGAITEDQEQKFLQFIKENVQYVQYYDAIYILFDTGMRISEFCGLTLQAVAPENREAGIQVNFMEKIPRKNQHKLI